MDKIYEGVDRFNAPIYKDNPLPVDNVLVSPGSLQDVLASNRSDGVLVAYTLQFPKSYLGDLAGKSIQVCGHLCAVVGNPDRYENAPGEWNMSVEVESVDG